MRKITLKKVGLYIKDMIISKIRIFIFNLRIKKKINYKYKFDTIKFENDKLQISDDEIKLAGILKKHKFNILGSGYTNVNKDGKPSDIDGKYFEIDWQRDFKSGYCFDCKIKSEKIKNVIDKGIDVKVPWELARMQHLLLFSKVYLCTNDLSYLYEIKNEILDFIQNNPVNYGVNWKCTMDVAIRISNIIVSVMLTKPYDDAEMVFDQKFMNTLVQSIYEHAVFIRYHLEDKRNFEGNHYLSNLTGLIFSSSIFIENSYFEKMFLFAMRKLKKTVGRQFLQDGGNFESSIPYHKLSTELMLYSTFYAINVVKEEHYLKSKLNKEIEYLLTYLDKALKFFDDTLKPNLNIYQLGDNDSGYLFKFNRYLCGENENELNCTEFNNVILYLYDDKFCEDFQNLFIKCLLSNSGLNKSDYFSREIKDFKYISNNIVYKNIKEINVMSFDVPKDIMKIKRRQIFFNDFGIYGFKNHNLYLAINATPVGQNGIGGHSHNDKLSVELQINNKDILTDYGSYVYTASLSERNDYRSIRNHNTMYFGCEQNDFIDCFSMKDETKCQLITFNENEIKVACEYKDIIHVRKVILEKSKIIIKDYSNKNKIISNKKIKKSYGYGKR